MTRITSSVTHKKRVKKVIKQASGYYGKRKNIYSVAKQSVTRSGMFSFAHRKKKKGDFRRIWQVRLNAALAELSLPCYSRFVHLLRLNDIRLNRKSLAYLAVNDPEGIEKIHQIIVAKDAKVEVNSSETKSQSNHSTEKEIDDQVDQVQEK